jgi:hypothetical protein
LSQTDGKSNPTGNAIIVAIFAAALLVVFTAFRSTDLLKLPSLAGNLGGGPLFGDPTPSLIGLIAAVLILQAWVGLGKQISRLIDPQHDPNASVFLSIARFAAIGSVVWSIIWFFTGVFGGYKSALAIGYLIVGNILLALPGKTRVGETNDGHRWWKGKSVGEWALVSLAAVPVILALIASLAPPIAKDTLLYHFALPKAFIAQGGNAFIDGNIASYLALGTEMHTVWAMLLGNLIGQRAGESAAGATVFLFFPLLLAAVFGWARQAGVSRVWSLLATLIVASIPTAFHVASSGYVDLSLAVYITLAVYSLSRWWRTTATTPLIFAAIFLGGALAVKLTAVFVIAASALIILLRARREPEATGKIVLTGFAALVLAGVIASPWYLRNWATTGSPVFPFYMSIWKGNANGWDVERSSLFQGMNSQYGGADVERVNYLIAPLRFSLAAQPENPSLYDGVLGTSFLIGLPLLIWGIWKKRLPEELIVAAGVAGITYFFWLFSSQQLRYLLPIMPLLAVGIAAAAEAMTSDKRIQTAWQYSLVAASLLAGLTSIAWFCQKAPLRVALGGETRDHYLTRNLDYYPYYQAINTDTATNAKVWLINMRRDTYNIERPVFSDYLFEDWTLRNMVWGSRSTQELKAKAAAMGVQYVLTRHDFLFDFDKSTLVDDKKSRAENDAKLKIAREFILDPANTIKADNKFSLIKVFSE